MGNNISSIGRDSIEEDERWLKMPANDLFDLEVIS